MVARAKKRKWVNLVAGLLVGTAAQPLALFAGPDTGLASRSLHAEREELVVAQLTGGASRAHLALNGAIDAQRQGDLDSAAALFREAQARQNDLTPDERRELDRLLAANALAMQSRLKAREQLNQAEAALQRGYGPEAAALLKTITASELYLSPADKQRYQGLCQKVHLPPIGAAAPAGGNSPAQAHSKLQQARIEMSRANLDAAEALAHEVEQMKVPFGPREDSPRCLLDDLAKARKDPRTMLSASRAAMQRGELDKAEQYARAAEQTASSWTFTFSSDSPSKALKEIQVARAADAKTGPTPGAVEQARLLVHQGKQALAAGDVAGARRYAEQAAALKADLHWSEENPASLLDQINRAESGPKAGPESGVVRTKDEAQALLVKGREQLAKGEVEEAGKTAARLRAAKHIHWGLFFEDTPDKFQADVDRIRAQRGKEKAAELMVEARRCYERKDYDTAEKKAYEAQKLHGSYSIWDLGDRPSKLLADVQAMRQKDHRIKLPEAPTVAKESADLSHGPLAQMSPPSTPPGMNGSTQPPVVPSGPRPQAPAEQFHNMTAQAPRPPAIVPPGPMQASNPAPQQPTPRSTAVAGAMRARQLLVEARTLQRQDRLVEAHDKIVEAQRLGVSFRPDEDNPNELYQQVAFQARQRIDSLVRHAGETLRYGTQAPAARCQEADKDLTQARQLASAFGQDMQPIERTAQMVNQMRRTGDLTLVSNPPTSGGMLPPPGIEKGPAPAASPTARGLQLLEQARLELNKGETATARRFAEEAVSCGVRDQALAVLRSIDTEEMNQRALNANRSFNAVLAAYNRRDYHQAGVLLSAIDTKLLDERRKARLREIVNTPEMQPALRDGTAIALTGAHEPPQPAGKGAGPQMNPEFNPQPILRTPGAGEAGKARVSDDQSLLARTKAMQEVKFQQLRQRGMDVQSQALERFRSGQTDAALDMLQDYLTELSQEQLEPGQLSLLRRPIDSRLQQFRLMKAQVDFTNQSTASTREAKARILKAQNAEQVKQKNVAELMKQYNELFKLGKYAQAEALAMRAKELDPDNPMATAAVTIARVQRHKDDYRNANDQKKELFLGAMLDADKEASPEVVNSGISFEENPERRKLIHKRDALDTLHMPRKSAEEKAVERKLTTPVSLNFINQPLRSVIGEIRGIYGVNIYVDEPALAEKGISQDMPVTIQLEQIALKSALNLLLHSVHLTYVVKDDVLQITTEDQARGKLERRVFNVTDLVIAVENYGQNGVSATAQLGMENVNSQLGGSASPVTGPNTLNGGQNVGVAGGGSMAGASSNFATDTSGGSQIVKHSSKTNEDMLIKLITNSVEPKSWSDQGGPGTLEYHPLTMSLVINQTPDIQDQVADLLAALRRLQDQEVAVEVKFISIAEDFFERIGVNFNLNIVNKGTSKFQPELVSGQFANPFFINQFTPDRFISGLTPAGTLTSDLNIPITQTTYQQAIPPFGGYPGVPGYGGLTLGLAFLSDIQVFLFMEAVQGDIRSNVMQAPKLTLFNGQTATILVRDFQFFVVAVNVIPQMGQFTYFPMTTLFPLGVSLTINAVITADRRFVRLSLTPTMSNLVNGEINLFPVVTPIFPLFDGTATGQPVVFTQFVQQPRLTSVTVMTTVAVPDGGTVLMGGLKRLSEGRNEFGPPVLSKIPYLNRLFRNTAYGRSAESLLIMVTPRIIIQAEEEEKQTGYVAPPPLLQ